MRADEIRSRFLDYFARQGHQVRPSSSLVPADDPTLLFTNSGMVQFKKAFLGMEEPGFRRAATSQKCVRAGGKHNDLEQVGVTARHHTFFEMLGNFSFGDYFKRDAIRFAWELLTEEFGMPRERLWVTVHYTDDEAIALWREISGLPEERIFRLGDKDNFWQMADTGPCGPCSEIHFDMRPEGTRGTEVTQEEFEELGEAGVFLEIWNLVFMQYDRDVDGNLSPLPAPSIDTGSGLERVASVLQGVDSNYKTDLFVDIIARAVDVIGVPYTYESDEGVSYRVLADHARATAFLLADGVFPSNEGRGYVLRRILRRAVRHAYLLGRREPTLVHVVEAVIDRMGVTFPELLGRREYIVRNVRGEEERFLATIEAGIKLFDQLAPGTEVRARHVLLQPAADATPEELEQLRARAEQVRQRAAAGEDFETLVREYTTDSMTREQGGDLGYFAHGRMVPSFEQAVANMKLGEVSPVVETSFGYHVIKLEGIRQQARGGTLAGADVFKLYDTFGFPVDLTALMAAERGYSVDVDGFEEELEAQRSRSRADRLKSGLTVEADALADGWEHVEGGEGAEQEYAAYRATALETDVLAYRRMEDGRMALQLRENPFYAESGGQISDSGHVRGEGWTMAVQEVRKVAGRIAIVGPVEGDFLPGVVRAEVEEPSRRDTERNHTATHLLHAALRKVLGEHVHQMGSLVAPDRLRFDFAHNGPMTAEETEEVEVIVNRAIWANEPVGQHQMGYRDALSKGAMALFSEKYGDIVRVIEIPGVSMELCGGTHVRTTGQIGLFRIVSESGVAAGVRRVEAVTGPGAFDRLRRDEHTLREAAGLLKTREENLVPRLQQVLEQNRELQRQLERARQSGGADEIARLLASASDVGGAKVIASPVEVADADELRALGDRLRQQLGSGVAVLSAAFADRTALFAVATDDVISRGVRADAVIREVAAIAGGKGGGKPHMAQAGVGDPSRVPEALARVIEIVRPLLNGA
jgi:alanyl-tRNA synthetase